MIRSVSHFVDKRSRLEIEKNTVEGGKKQKQADGGRVFSPNSRVFSVQYDCAIQSWLTRSRPFVPRQPLVSSILQCG